jgi:peptidoglycan/LPS O-acetylase OafA/YrhL
MTGAKLEQEKMGVLPQTEVQHKLYFSNLDAVRTIAALMVYAAHAFQPTFQFLPIKGTFVEKVLMTITSGGTGVLIFFVLSGFLITYLLLTEQKYSGTISVKNFYIRRTLRIWPLYFLVIFFTFGLYPLLKSFAGISTALGSNVVYHIFFLSNFDVINILQHCYGSDARSQNITWSIAVEEQFYLVWPWIVVLVPGRYLIHAIASVIVASFAFRIINHNDVFVLYYHTIAVFMSLAMGGLFAYVCFSRQQVREFFYRSAHWLQGLSIVVVFLWMLYKNDILPKAYAESVSFVVSAFLFAVVVASQSFSRPESKMELGKIKFATALGKYTYGIYMLHPIVLLLLDVVLRMMHVSADNFLSGFLLGIAGLILTLGASYISYRYFELYFLRLKKGFAVVVKN